MAILIVPNQELLDEIACTPNIEGGIGSVMMGTPLEAKDGRLAVCHPWSQVSMDWLSAYTANIAGAEVVEVLPKDFEVKEDEGILS